MSPARTLAIAAALLFPAALPACKGDPPPGNDLKLGDGEPVRNPQHDTATASPTNAEPAMVPTSAGGKEEPRDGGGPRPAEAPGKVGDSNASAHENKQNKEMAPGVKK
jgi:hypothetical protein